MDKLPRRTAAVVTHGVSRRINNKLLYSISFYNGLLWMVIILSPFQNTSLQNTPLNMAGASPSFIPLMALLILAGAHGLLRNPFVIERSTLILALYVGVVCAASLVWINHGEITVSLRSLRGYPLLTALILFTVFRIRYRIGRGVRIAIYLAFCLTILGIVCEQMLGAKAIPLLQVSRSLDGRPSGFSTEASTLSVQIVASGMLAAHFLERRWLKWSVIAATCALLVFGGSKGGLISLLLCVIVLGIVKMRSSILSKILTLFVVLPLVYFGSLYILSIFGTMVDANITQTIATRSSMAVYALITVAHNPFGVGFTGFLPSIPRYLPQAIDIVQHTFPFPLGFSEVKGYLYPPQTDADCKTFFFDYLVFFGIPFAIVFFRFVVGLLTRLFRCQCYWLFVGVLFSVMALMTYYSSINAWTLPLLFGISIYEIKRIETSVCVQ